MAKTYTEVSGGTSLMRSNRKIRCKCGWYFKVAILTCIIQSVYGVSRRCLNVYRNILRIFYVYCRKDFKTRLMIILMKFEDNLNKIFSRNTYFPEIINMYNF